MDRLRCTIGLSLLLLLAIPASASAQSIGIGGGFGFPFTTYVEDELEREFRVVPEPGYYPVLRERTNENFGLHLHVSLILEGREFLWIFDDLEIRFDFIQYDWDEATNTHTGCDPIPVFNDDFDAATANFEPLPEACCFTDDAGVQRCLDDFDYNTVTDISELELPALQMFNIDIGGHYRLFDQFDTLIFLGLNGGLTLSTFVDPGAEVFFGGNLAGSVGVVYNFSTLFGVELEARLTGVLTEAPDSLQTRINADAQTGGWIGATILETFLYSDIQFGLRLNLDAI